MNQEQRAELWADRLESLFDVLPMSGNREELGDVLGWTVPEVDSVLSFIRRPDNAKENGWTVPHAGRGRGDHLYQAILVDDRELEANEVRHTLIGLAGTAHQVATMGENEAYALTIVAKHTPDKAMARKIRNFARALDGAAAMAPDVEEVLRLALNGS